MTLRTLVAGALLCLAGGARAQLASGSPFLPSQAAGVAAPTQNAPLEFAGMIENADGVPQYRIVDRTRKIGAWIKLNERNPDLGVLIKQYDAERNTVTLDQDGKALTLEERKSKVVSSGSAAAVVPPMVPGQPPNMNPAVVASVVPNPSPADEQKRLEAVAQEVARRRALREQAATGQVAPAPVAIPQIQQQQPQRAQPQVTPQGQNNGNARRGPGVNRQQR